MLKSKDQNSHYKLRTKRINPHKSKKIKDKIRKIYFNLQNFKKETQKQIILSKLNHNEIRKLNEKQKQRKSNKIVQFILVDLYDLSLLFIIFLWENKLKEEEESSKNKFYLHTFFNTHL